jgi:hypothetical protein
MRTISKSSEPQIAGLWTLRTQGANAPTSTLGGRMEAQQMKANLLRPSPLPVLHSYAQLPTARVVGGGRSNQQTAVAQPLGTTGESKQLLSNILCMVAGVIGVVFAARHGVKSGLGEGLRSSSPL